MLIRPAADGRPGVRIESFGRFQIYYPPNRQGLTLPLADDDKALDDVPGLGEIGNDAVGGALDDARPGRDVAEPDARVVGDA